jgi:hypothetical protein
MTLPHPGKIISADDYDGRWGPLDDDFKEYFKILIESILSPESLIKKKIYDKEMTANDMIKYTATIFRMFKQSELPDVNSVFDMTVAAEMNKLVDDAVNEYIRTMTNHLDYSKENFAATFFDDHKLIQLAVVGKFKLKPKMADTLTEKNTEKIIITKTEEYFTKWKDTVLKTHTDYMINKIRKEEAEKRAREEIEKQAERDRQAVEARLRAELAQRYRSPPKHSAGHWLCKIFTLGIHRC